MPAALTFNILGHDVSATSTLDKVPAAAAQAGAKAGSGFSTAFDNKFGDGFGVIKSGLQEIPVDAAQAGGKAGSGFGDAFKGKAEQGFGELKSKMGDLVGGLGLGAVVGSALKGAWDNNQNQFKLQAALGLSPAQAKSDADTAAKIYAGAWGDSLDEVDGAIGNVRKGLGNLSKVKLEGLTTQALAFQQTFGVDTSESINAVSQMLRTGLAKNAQEAFDIITAGEQSGADKAGDLFDTFNEYGTQFRKLGLDGKTALGLIQQGLQGGARDSDIVADAIKEFSLRSVGNIEQMDSKGRPHLTALGQAFVNVIPHGTTDKAYALQKAIAKGGKGASAALQTVLDGLRGIPDPVQKAQMATTMFGTQAEDLGAALYKLDPATASAAKGMGNIDGAGKRLTDTIGKTTSPIEALQRSAMKTLADLGAHALPILQPVLGVISKLGPELAIAATGFAAMFAINKVVGMAQTFATTISGLAVKLGLATAATEAETVAQTELDAAMDANPIGLIVIALAALAAGFVYAWKHSETFRNIVKGVFGAIKTAGLFLWNNILKPIFAAWKFEFRILAAVIKGTWDNVIHPVWTALKTAAQFVWGVLKVIFDAYKMEWRILSDVFKAVWNNALHPVISAIATAFRAVWDVLKTVFGKIKDGIRGVRDVIKFVVGVIKGVWSGIGDGLQAVWDNTLGPVFNGIKTAIGWIISKIEWVINKIAWIAGHMPSFTSGPFAGEFKWDPKTQKLVPANNAQGTGHFAGGRTVVGELGPEILDLPPGSQITPTSIAMSQAGGGGDTYHFEIHMPGQFYGSKAEFGRVALQAVEAAVQQGAKARVLKGLS